MRYRVHIEFLALAVLISTNFSLAQTQPAQTPVSVNATLVLDAAGPEQRQSLDSIYLIACRDGGVLTTGTGFLLDSGDLITNAHVTATCDESSLVGITAANHLIHFSRVVKDPNRDLALLVPKDKLLHGLKLAARDNPPPGTVVLTWGYPFAYDGASPLLSVGYVSGYRTDSSHGKPVKHIVVNGAFNHGNSGGPLLVAHHKEVIGVVVMTFHFYPPQVKQIIDTLSKESSGLVWDITRSDGSLTHISEAQITALVLEEFYEKTQVMIGEAISASEVSAFLKEHAQELAKQPSQLGNHNGIHQPQ